MIYSLENCHHTLVDSGNENNTRKGDITEILPPLEGRRALRSILRTQSLTLCKRYEGIHFK